MEKTIKDNLSILYQTIELLSIQVYRYWVVHVTNHVLTEKICYSFHKTALLKISTMLHTQRRELFFGKHTVSCYAFRIPNLNGLNPNTNLETAYNSLSLATAKNNSITEATTSNSNTPMTMDTVTENT